MPLGLAAQKKRMKEVFCVSWVRHRNRGFTYDYCYGPAAIPCIVGFESIPDRN